MRTQVGFYGDDFTGSVDALLQYRRVGLTGVLVTDAVHLTGLDECHDVVGIAGTARALPTDQMAAEVEPALDILARRVGRVVQYKASSTADSTAAVGSLGRALDIGRDVLGRTPIPVLFAQPDFGRYTVFGTHFAADADGVHRLDRHPTMSRHPVSPMHEADLLAMLGQQTSLSIGGVPLIGRVADPCAPGALTAGLVGGVPDVLVLDALDERDVSWAGAAILGLPDQPVFALGSGGLSRGVGLALGGAAAPLRADCSPAAGPVLAVSGSCSALTWRQVQDAAARGWQAIDALSTAAPATAARRAVESGASTVVYTSRPHGPEASGARVAGLLADVVASVAGAEGVSRVVVAGGDTSGRVLTLLGAASVEIEAAPWGNTALCRVRGGVLDHLQTVLKGGQMGPDDLFERVRVGATIAPAG